MSERNEDVLKMIEQLKARLDDLENDVRNFEGDLPDMAKRIDHLDDKVYLLELEIESRGKTAQGEAGTANAATAQAGQNGAVQGVASSAAAGEGANAASAQAEAPKADQSAQPAAATADASASSSTASANGANAAATNAASGDDEDDEEETMHILTPEAKAKIGETVGDLAEIGKSGMETLADLNEALGDIAAPFKSLKKFGRRRF